MSEERLQGIKGSVEFQKEMLKAHNMTALSLDEEEELIEEIERLNNIIGEATDKAIQIQKTFGYVLDDLIYLLMHGSDKE